MRQLIIFFIFICSSLLWNCQLKRDSHTINFPSTDQINITWELLNDAVEEDHKRTAIFTITNESDTILPGHGWALYYNQFAGAIYLEAAIEDLYDISNLGGDLYRITPLDSFPDLTQGSSMGIRYKGDYRLIKKTHAPQGLYFVCNPASANELIKPVNKYKIKAFPEDFTYATTLGDRKLHMQAAERFELNESIKNIPAKKLEKVIPTPFETKYHGTNFLISPNVKIMFDQGLKGEADHLATILNEALINPILVEPVNRGDTGVIFLRQEKNKIADRYSEAYRLSIQENKGIEIIGTDKAGVFYGIQTLKALLPPNVLSIPSEKILLPTLTIKDAPRFSYRGQHIDIARNYYDADELKKVITLMAFYKLNKLHLHLTDDEGWRLEIPGLPELTEVGAKRGHGFENGSALPPSYGSSGLTSGGAGSGFLSREDFIDLLKYAKKHHIEIIPEINGPGHARAAIKAMDARYERLIGEGKEVAARQYLLRDRKDASMYSSAQNYHDNVICVCQEYTYTFVEKVIKEVVAMYEEADAPLSIIHSGGDEVPGGAWQASPECERLIKEETTLTSTQDLLPYFARRYAEIAAKYNLRIGGWEEIVMRANPADPEGKHLPNPDMLATRAIPYVWNSVVGSGNEDLIYQLANMGYDVIMCNASNLYLDMAYNIEPEEPGLYWAGYVDTKNVFELTPFDIFRSVFADEEGNALQGMELGRNAIPLKPEAEANLLGIQGQLWTETIRTTRTLEYMLLPKLLGLAERAWAAPPKWLNYSSALQVQQSIETEWSAFANRIGKLELPRLDYLAGGFNYRIPPPGAKVDSGKLIANVAFPGLQIRYTIDGSDPNPYSPLYSTPVPVKSSQVIKLRVFNSNNRGSRLTEIANTSAPDS